MAEFSSNAKGNAALATGIIGTAGVALPLINGLLGGMGGHNHGCSGDNYAMSLMTGLLAGRNNGGCSEDHCVNRYELGLQNEIAAKDSKISLLESNIYVDSKIADVYERLNTKIGGLEAQICHQAVVNAQVTANISCMQNAINVLNGLTKTVIPIGNVCPAPMPEFNSWTAPTAPTTGA